MRHDRLLKDMLRKRYLVTTVDGDVFDGLLLDADDEHLMLADAQAVAANGDRMKIDGHLWLPRFNVTYMQQPKP